MSVVPYDKLKETVSYAFVKVNDDNVNVVVVVVGIAKRGRISTVRNKRYERAFVLLSCFLVLSLSNSRFLQDV